MKRVLLIFAALLVSLSLHAQLPQFSNVDFDGWNYSNPAIELTGSNIVNNRIVLYTNSEGRHLTLTSPPFACHGGQTLDMTVTWITTQWQSSKFVVSKVALTAALVDDNGVALDSVTWTPASVSQTNKVNLSLTVPGGVTSARLRFASWNADVNSNGAVRKIEITEGAAALDGDVNLDGEVNIADVNAVIDIILGSNADDGQLARADVNHDGEINIADVNAIIDIIFRG